MPLPVAAGIIAWITALATSNAAIEGLKFAKKIAIIGAVIVAFFAAIGVLGAAIDAAIGGITATFPSGWVAVGVGLLPGVTPYLISAILAAHAAVWVFKAFFAVAQFKLNL